MLLEYPSKPKYRNYTNISTDSQIKHHAGYWGWSVEGLRSLREIGKMVLYILQASELIFTEMAPVIIIEASLRARSYDIDGARKKLLSEFNDHYTPYVVL